MGVVDWINRNIPCLLSRKTAFLSMTILLSAFFLTEMVVGYVTNSMALIADAFHMLSDVASLVVGYLALRYSSSKAPKERYTFGYARAEVLGALVNAVFLVALCFSIFIEAMKRLVLVEGIEDPMLVFSVGAIGLIVNAFGVFLFHQQGMQHGHSHGGGGHGHSHGGGGHGHSHGGGGHKESLSEKDNANGDEKKDEAKEGKAVTSVESIESTGECGYESYSHSLPESDEEMQQPRGKQLKSASQLNINGVYLHILGDALGSVIVMISALIIMLAHGQWTLYVDPAMSIIMVMIILKTSIPLLKETSMILMQTVPTHLSVEEITEKLIKTIPGILDVHEFHVWQLSGDRIIASVHVKFHAVEDYMATASDIKNFFHREGIHSTTIQLEFESANNPTGSKCMIVCTGGTCADMTCCKINETTPSITNSFESNAP
eukprot:gene6010-6708_t